MGHALLLLPDRPLSPAGWLPQGFVLVADIVFGAGTCGSGAVTFPWRINCLLRRLRAFAGPARHGHVIELLAVGVDAQARAFL